MRKLILAVVATAALATASPALGAYSLFGGATLEPGDVKLVSNTGDASATNDASGIDFTDADGLTFSALTALSTDYNVTDDDCSTGSPRFQINVDLGGGNVQNVFVYLGPTPNFTGCAKNTWLPSGNLAGTSELRVDTSQVGGQFYDNWAGAVAKVGGKTVTGIQLVVDSGYAFGDKEQTVLVRNVNINGTTYFKVSPQPGNPNNPAKLCKAQRDFMGPNAFNELWGKNANDRNAFGKCVSAMAKLQNAEQASAQSSIIKAAKECRAKGLRGAALGACVSQHDGLAQTKADPPNRGKKKGR